MIKIKKVLPIFILLVLVVVPPAFAGTAFHSELDTALVTNIRLDNPSLSNTFRLGAKGESYTLDLAATYNPKDSNSFNGIKGIGPSFSLKGWGITFQLDTYIWPNKYARAGLKYKVSDLVNAGVFAQSNLNYSYDFGMLVSICY